MSVQLELKVIIYVAYGTVLISKKCYRTWELNKKIETSHTFNFITHNFIQRPSENRKNNRKQNWISYIGIPFKRLHQLPITNIGEFNKNPNGIVIRPGGGRSENSRIVIKFIVDVIGIDLFVKRELFLWVNLFSFPSK